MEVPNRLPDAGYEDATPPAHSFSQVDGVLVTMHYPASNPASLADDIVY